ncbi:MAG: aspartate kinase [Sphaerochaetaceae bacterium]|jgi:aspartate kinase|nr:aspartate kinase [Sphaerochaetaceae bacterium]MDY0371152.1 aspartate kinase [Sphaerochaetaceae bacterium]
MENKKAIWVSKFGGTSLANAQQIKKVKEIIFADERRNIVVVSAPGKEDPTDTKITDLLLQCHALASQGKSFDEPFANISKRFLTIAAELQVGQQIKEELKTIYKRLFQEKSADYAASRGEYLNALIISEYFGAEFVDAKEIIRLTSAGRVDELSYDLTAKRLTKCTGRIVIPGFYGTNTNGTIQTFSRGGSDITGAIVARAVQAELYENWTDVSGIYLADPRIVPDAKPVAQITYREIRELSCIGANVLHEDAIGPVRSAQIPIHIKNTNDSTAPGTIIRATRDSNLQHIVGVSGKKGYRKLSIEKFMLATYPALKEQLQQILHKKKIRFDLVVDAFDAMTIYLSTEIEEEQAQALAQELQLVLDLDNCQMSEPLVLIGLVGEGLGREEHLAERINQALGTQKRYFSLLAGVFDLKMVMTVPVKAYESTLQAIVEVVRT